MMIALKITRSRLETNLKHYWELGPKASGLKALTKVLLSSSLDDEENERYFQTSGLVCERRISHLRSSSSKLSLQLPYLLLI